MPTGYTAAIADGITFPEFAMSCARAFGALVMMRDEPNDAPIPDEFPPSDYHAKAIVTEKAKLAALHAMTEAEAERGAAKAFDDAETARVVRLTKIADQRARYEAMLKQARAWRAPTPDHEGLKTFMCQQIEQSIDWDCSTKYHGTPAAQETGTNWRAEQKAAVIRSIAYHEKEHAEEVTRAASRTAWVRDLRASLR